MPRMFIADSEDEDEDGAPPSPPPAALPSLVNGQSSDPLSRGTDSTDTAFFRSVYHEQTEAVQERARSASNGAQAVSRINDAGRQRMWEVPSSPDPQPASSRRKRRKLSNDAPSSPRPVEDGVDNTGSSMLPPTLQIDNEAAFVITPSAMTKSQRERYQLVNCPSSLDHEPATTLQAPQRVLDLASSSSGTNLNTQRTYEVSTQAANTPKARTNEAMEYVPEHMSSPAPRPRSSRRRRFSSPDVIAVADVTERQDEHPEAGGEDGGLEEESFTAPDTGDFAEPAEPIVIEDDGSSFDESPAKPKKKRGRPKKTKSTDVVPAAKAQAGPEEPSTAQKPPTAEKPSTAEKPAKKKRGRPRKEPATPAKPLKADEGTSSAKDQPEISVDNLVQVEQDQSPNADTSEVTGPDQAGVGQDESGNGASGKSEEVVDQSHADKASEATSVAQKVESKTANGVQGKRTQIGTTDDGKPVYRIGLSKRTRIAPLLKIIRK